MNMNSLCEQQLSLSSSPKVLCAKNKNSLAPFVAFTFCFRVKKRFLFLLIALLINSTIAFFSLNY